MTRPNLILSALIESETGISPLIFDTSSLDNFELDFASALDNLGDSSVGAGLDADPTSIQATRIQWGNATNGAVLTGSGLNQIEDIDALKTRLDDGIASGAFNKLSIISGGQEVLALNFSTNALMITSGAQSLSVTGTLPTSLQGIFNFVSELVELAGNMDLRVAAAALTAFDLEGVRLIDGSETLLDVTLSNSGLKVLVGGGEFNVEGSIPTSSLGSLIGLIADLQNLDETAAGFNNLNQQANLSITNVSLTGADGTVLLRTTGAIEELDLLFANLTITGTNGNDTAYLDFGDGVAKSVTAQLGAGNDTAEVDGYFKYYENAVQTTFDGGAGVDTLRIFDFESRELWIDLTQGFLRGYQDEGTTGSIGYEVGLSNVENIEMNGGGRTVIEGDQNGNTVRVSNVFGEVEFRGGGGGDTLDFSGVKRLGLFEDGLKLEDLGGFSAFYAGDSTIELSHADLFGTFRVNDVEQVMLSTGAGTTTIGLNQLLSAAGNAAAFGEVKSFIAGTAGADSLKGTAGQDFLLGQSGGDFIYGDGIQANQTGTVAGQVYRMYQATLDRAPDASGYEDWVTRLYEGTVNINQMAGGFVNSREFQNTYGDLENADFVELLYQNVLNRSPDVGGLQNWLNELGIGVSRADVVAGFSQSLEFQNTTAAASAEFAVSYSSAVWTDEVYRVYRATLDRDPDIGGFTDWAGRLGSGTTFETMIGGFVNSREFSNTYGELDDEAFVEQLYQNVLNRGSDAGGLQSWIDFIDGGGSRAGVVSGFSQSLEFIRNTSDDLTSWVNNLGPHDEIVAGNGPEMNVLSGGLLSDVFIFEPGQSVNATIVDLETWDVILLDEFDNVSDFGAFQAGLQQTGNNVTFTHSSSDTQITFANMAIDGLMAEQLLFT